ncbi:MAG TPA: hypothetical protein VJC05_03260 [Candidatus Andersenbacteria bacterium]|nr:MAG: hypothetical protein A2854_05145 [Parcubacteria group bacterium RIFCSPHIGHO2_01_FULL_56_18]HLD26034.1 hypothetical protein [Candidatus Andersenbacteria bacterium]
MNNTNEEQGGFLQRVQESPRTVSALIIILIVAAAIYAFSGNEEPQVGEMGTPATTEAGSVTNEAAEKTPRTVGEEMVAEEREEAATEAPEVPQAERTERGFVEVAQAGDGYTHLARRATTRWLSENQVDFAVTEEHRIYIEDYIQNRMGTEGLAVNDSHTVTFDLLQEAVSAAGELDESQLKNLSQYTSALQ